MTALLVIAAALALGGGDTLTIGDPAPSLDVAHWLKGEPVNTLEPGRVYVIEFWATWCAPCVANVPHLSAVQREHADAGLTVIGISDEPLSTVVRFACSRSRADDSLQYDRIAYTLATDPDGSVFDDYMRAAGQNARPTAFIIGRDGRVEWVGQPWPDSMDEPLRAVLAGDWDRAAFKTTFEAARARAAPVVRARAVLSRAMEAGDWEAALEPLDELVALGRDTYAPTKLAILLSRLGDRERGDAYARALMERAWEDDPWTLYQVAWVISGSDDYPIEPELRDLDLALRVITRANDLDGWSDFDRLALQAKIEFEIGRRAEAVEHQRMAVERLEALESRIRDDELEDWRDLVKKFRATLRRYEQ